MWIGVRPSRDVAMRALDEVDALPGKGLLGDRYTGRSGIREVTFLQWEHLAVIAALLGKQLLGKQLLGEQLLGEQSLGEQSLGKQSLCDPGAIEPARLRRNLLVSGINLIALQRTRFTIGNVLLEGTGACHPCSKMERVLGAGGYNAMRGHGGITARVIEGGALHLGDAVSAVDR